MLSSLIAVLSVMQELDLVRNQLSAEEARASQLEVGKKNLGNEHMFKHSVNCSDQKIGFDFTSILIFLWKAMNGVQQLRVDSALLFLEDTFS